MSSLTIVVPRLGSDAAFETTLASILRYRLPHHQVIVVQGSSDVDDYGLGDEATFLTCQESGGLAHYLNQAIPIVTGEVVNLILPGVEVHNQWFAPAMRELTQVDAGCVSIPVFVGEQLISRGLGFRADSRPGHISDESRIVAGPAKWAGCFRRTMLQQIFPLNGELGDDLVGLEIGLAAKGLGLRCVVACNGGVSIEESLSIELPEGFRSGWVAQRLQQRYGQGNCSVIGKFISAIRFGIQIVQPTKWSYLAGRKSAKRNQDADEEFASWLASAANRPEVSGEVDSSNRRSPRRAA